MLRRTYIIGTVALGLMLTAAGVSPVFDRLVSSAQNFQLHYRDLKQTGDSLSPLERVVFSLVLANGEQPVSRAHHT
jgi:hypothetical protein